MRSFIPLLILFLVFNSQFNPRQQLIDLIFGGSLPIRQPDTIEKDIIDSAWSTLDNLKRMDRITVQMDFGLESVAYHFIPQIQNGQLMIYHEGHWLGGFIEHRAFIQAALDHGFAVAAFDMPFYGHNSTPKVKVLGHDWMLTQHGQIAYLEPATGHPIRYFLEPVVVFLNYADSQGYAHISMVGLSGGGWATTLIAALDRRIESSFPVAGTYPLFIRGYDWGDWEQNEPDVYRIADYDDLYVLGASNGRQLQIINRYDSCCFEGLRWQAYYADVRERSGGAWDLWLDETQAGHDISPAAMTRIFEELKTFGTIYRIYMPVVIE